MGAHGHHHHLIVRLTDGGLSECMREVHGRFSRQIHEVYGQTRAGHLVRHGFFARELKSDAEVLVACRYVDLNLPAAVGISPAKAKWCGYRATVGLCNPRAFHDPSELLGIVSAREDAARFAYRRFVEDGLASLRQVSSPNHDDESRAAHG